ncbi:MAG: hypothetical protein HYU36_04765 [Planctomycetes bacterium]|nr:hypothetical protein [Planctomycetota bacterium]
MQSHRQALAAQELLSTITQPGLEVFQVTTNPAFGCNVFYNYQEAFEPTSRFVIFNGEGQGLKRVILCDLQDGFELAPLNDEPKYEAACFSPDGRFVYYSVLGESVLAIRRRSIADRSLDTVFVLDRSRPEFGGRKITWGRWIAFSHDGRRFLTTANIEGKDKYYSVAVFTFDMQRMAFHTSFETGPRNWNNKNQYAPCLGPQGEYLIGVCDCYSQAYFDEKGHWQCETLEVGGAELLVDEAGTVRYAYPVGRDRPRQNVSHNSWFGRSVAKVFHVDAFDLAPHWRGAMMLADPVAVTPETQGLGRNILGGKQLDLTRHITRPDVWHLCIDTAGRHMVCDTHALGYDGHGVNYGVSRYIYACTVREDAQGPYVVPKYILHPHSTWTPYWCEALPCFTPDRQWILFNSDYNGVRGYSGPRHVPQVFAVRNFEFP